MSLRAPDNLYSAIAQYQEFLVQLEQSSTAPQPQEIFQVLRSRDLVQAQLSKGKPSPDSLLLRLIELDQRLQKQESKITYLTEYPNWRKSLNPTDASWWWYFSPPKRSTKLDWLWNGLSLVFLTISVSLIVDGIPRFLSGGLDIASVLAIIIPSLLTLLTSGALTPIGREARKYLFQKLDQSRWSLISLVLSFLLALSLIIIHQFFFDNFAVYFQNQGLNFYKQGQLEQALSNYQKAVALDPNDERSHYYLGIVYEDLQQFDKATTEYQIAVKQDNSLTKLEAYNNWGHLLILQQEYTQAIAPLIEGKNSLDESQVKTSEEFQKVKYALLKNLGWAQLELKNYSEAKSLLQDAIALNSTQAPAYCLLAQVLEAQKEEALTAWNSCIAYADSGKPDEYLWLSIAREKLK
ncbi:tetratricopeptide repeat protein [Xenococcus sp. PCC 7305]|uniref:tetratricopeptide repeat protein n=1 Tax=Xenococcus sp. PCC 7305 TaxID=102125 RepID=UPI0002AC8D0E|nr:tetratricopeptide repeat protein [Xenococcus sp. PCC 7305]ELS05143.1 tetratricopeptide repeat protein [Xenococcus sp. PCC 7305]